MQHQETNRGLFIVFEGLDRTGKTTQSKLLSEKMQAIHINFPNRLTATGKIIDDYLKKKIELNDQCVHLLFAANRWESMDFIETTLKSGVSIICDRYSYSGAVFTAAKEITGFDLQYAMTTEKNMIKPDIIFLFDAPVNELKKRNSYGEERYEVLELQTKVQKLFYELAANDPDTWYKIDVITDDNQPLSEETIHNKVMQRLKIKNTNKSLCYI